MTLNQLKNCYVYLAGPYANGDKEENAKRLIRIADKLMDAGVIVFNPLLSHWHHHYCPRSADFWYAYDLRWLNRCECLIYLPGPSKGVDLERKHAPIKGIPVYEIGEILPEWKTIIGE